MAEVSSKTTPLDGGKKKGEGGDGPLLVMLLMGIAIVPLTLRWADSLYVTADIGETILNTFIKTSVLGTGVPGDLFLLSFSYVPLMWLCIYLRNRGIGKSILATKTIYNVVMTAFSLYCFLVMAAWRFAPDFPGETHNKCETAITHTNSFGSFQLTAELFFWSKYIEWLDSVFLLYNGKPISVLHGFHHLGAPIAMGSMVMAKAEYVWIFVLWNSFVHTISESPLCLACFASPLPHFAGRIASPLGFLTPPRPRHRTSPAVYFYYFATGIGLKWPRILRPYITSMQIVQFCTGLPYLWVTYAGAISADGGACATSGRTFSFIFQFVYVGIVLGLFTHFFVMSYLMKSKSKSKSKKQ